MGTQAPIVKHSTDIEPPTCDPGWTELWTGFSYLMVGTFFRFEFVFLFSFTATNDKNDDDELIRFHVLDGLDPSGNINTKKFPFP